jgi:hypothetical protein
VFEDDFHHVSDVQRLGLALDEGGGEPNSRVLDERDLGHHIRRRQAGLAEALVEGESTQGGSPRDNPHADLTAVAPTAHWRGRMDQFAATKALLQPKPPVGPRAPEEFVLWGHQRERSRRIVGHIHLPPKIDVDIDL